MTLFSRRTLLCNGLSAGLAAGAALPTTGLLTRAAQAAAPLMGPSFAQHRRFSLGNFEVTTLLVGTRPREEPQTIFGMNVSADEFADVSADNFLSTTEAQFFFTPTIVNTGAELILFDTGLNAGAITAALASAGYTPDQVDVVVLTHMHGDHIGGMMNDGAPTFANARYVMGQVEFDHWAGTGQERFDNMVRPFAEKTTFIGDNTDVVSGITGLAAFGHTPGHMVFRIESEGEGLMLFADLANHPVWSLARPDWEVRFDADKAAAAATRRKVLGMIAADRLPAIGYHMPFPALGFIETATNGAEFRWVPEAGQMMG